MGSLSARIHRLIVVLRCAGQVEIGPKPVLDRSSARISTPVSPPPNGNSSSRLPDGVFWPIVLIVSQQLTLWVFFNHAKNEANPVKCPQGQCQGIRVIHDIDDAPGNSAFALKADICNLAVLNLSQARQ